MIRGGLAGTNLGGKPWRCGSGLSHSGRWLTKLSIARAGTSSECVVLPLDGDPLLAVDPPELGGALMHSWLDRAYGYDPNVDQAGALAKLLTSEGLSEGRIGVETASRALPVTIRPTATRPPALGRATSDVSLLAATTPPDARREHDFKLYRSTRAIARNYRGSAVWYTMDAPVREGMLDGTEDDR